jgi:sugar phosphate isomerase/epimerase
MQTQYSRRRFFQSSVCLGLSGLLRDRHRQVAKQRNHLTTAVDKGSSIEQDDNFYRFQLGLAAYCFRKSFAFVKGKPQQVAAGHRTTDMFQFIEYCSRQNVAGAELTSYFFPPDADSVYFKRLKHHAFKNGVTISGTAIGNNFSIGPGDRLRHEMASAKSWIDRAAEMGAPHVRFFAGTAREFARHPDNMKHAIDALRECVEYAEEKAVFVGVENHGQLTADQVWDIVHAIENPWFGVNLDSGNFFSEDPYQDLERIAPFAVNVQIKTEMRKPDGTRYPADLKRVMDILKSARYRGFVVLEYEDNDPWEKVPVVLEELRRAAAKNDPQPR